MNISRRAADRLSTFGICGFALFVTYLVVQGVICALNGYPQP